ncbi:MAG: PQQ-dependent sugar dehydrogenase [Ferruginibacter sp.]
MKKHSTFLKFAYSYITGMVLCMFLAQNTQCQPALSLSPVISTGLSAPIQFVNAMDGSNRIFIVQQGSTIRAYDAAFNFLSVFLTVSNVNVSGERGLLSMAFHPEYETNGLFYVYYTNTAGDLELARYQVSSDPNSADVSSKVILITIPHPTNSNHNGGELQFGNDGFLYLSTGDGGGAGDVPDNAQNTSVLLGKILRFKVNTNATAPYYTIPVGNPYGNEIFALGLRNPFRWSFDRATYDMWIGDVGQDSWEEINFRSAGSTAGTNFGWHCYEGNSTYNTTGCSAPANYVFPAYTYATQNPSAAITGGVVYRGAAYPYLQGYYIAADFYSGSFYKIVSNGSGGWNTYLQTLSPSGIADFGETEAGEVYVVSLTDNIVFHVVATPVLPLELVEFSGRSVNEGVSLYWRTAMEQNLSRYEIEYSIDQTVFTRLGTVPAKNLISGYRYNFLDNVNQQGIIFYRLKMINLDGSYEYSNIIRLELKHDPKNIIAPTVITDGIIHLNLSSAVYNSIELFSTDGKLLLKENIDGRTGNIQIPATRIARGMYVVRLAGSEATLVQKLIIQ